MKTSVSLPLGDPAALLSTWFGAGLLPKAPGTWGSLAALPFAWIISLNGGWPVLSIAILLVFLLGWWAADRTARVIGIADPGCIVIDEVAGQWLTLVAAPPDLLHYAIGFALFRLFDITKPWPANWADRRIKGGLGIMLDDVFAGLYGLIAMQLLALVWRHG
ncbi:phosphatidylglycerophosphatase A [Telmatospirillum siberiense]|uniref:Phosphatidylglycerophosphatase A n=1 Tax=Telmatospirillum siberiense TaxID=382514 RepID=A0A2N3PZ66_9PROT|nr:phosphatidylglycerophosphatase A [Telmatospirillum siberiense]PKU25703.1 phosphatidylglycerophosphatase A [Telmatospirillum siberiense]